MTLMLKPPSLSSDSPVLVPVKFSVDQLVTLPDNPEPVAAIVNNLVSSFRSQGQLNPGWVYPSPDLPDHQRILLEGYHRFAACQVLNWPFLAFDLGRFVPEEERIMLTFQHNHSRRHMGRAEIAERAARYMELTDSTAAAAAKLLNISEATLSRAFNEKRITLELREQADRLGLSIRSLIAAMPVELMPQAIDFALTPGQDGKKPIRDQVSLFLERLKKDRKPKPRPAKTVMLRVNGRTLTFTIDAKDTTQTVTEDFKSLVAKLGKHSDVPAEGWPFLFS